MGKKLRRNYNNYLFYIGIAFISFIYVVLFCYTASPFTTTVGNDSAFFRLVGQGMVKGMLPYRDFYDMKGPYLFAIEYLGQIVFYGRLGVFIIEWINLFLVICISSAIFSLYSIDKKRQFLLLFPCAWLAIATFCGGNTCEEYSLFPNLICLFLCLKYFRASQMKGHKPFYGMIYGMCFGFLAFVRINNAALICAIVFSICVSIIKDRQWNNLLHNIAAFIMGFFLATAPVVVFFKVHGCLHEMISAVFGLGVKYSSQSSVFEHQGESAKYPFRLLLCFLPVLLLPLKIDWKIKLLSITSSFATFISTSIGHNHWHYYVITIPLLVFTEAEIYEEIQKNFDRGRQRDIVCGVCLCLLVLFQINGVLMHSRMALGALIGHDKYYYEQSTDSAKVIPEAERNSVYYFDAVNLDWYVYNDLFPCNKYCGWQTLYMELNPSIKTELESFFADNPPQWLIMPKMESYANLPTFLNLTLSEHYCLEYENNEYSIFKLILC